VHGVDARGAQKVTGRHQPPRHIRFAGLQRSAQSSSEPPLPEPLEPEPLESSPPWPEPE
jgi:hypothetical protein